MFSSRGSVAYVEIDFKFLILWRPKSWHNFGRRDAILWAEWMVSAEGKSWRDLVLAW